MTFKQRTAVIYMLWFTCCSNRVIGSGCCRGGHCCRDKPLWQWVCWKLHPANMSVRKMNGSCTINRVCHNNNLYEFVFVSVDVYVWMCVCVLKGHTLKPAALKCALAVDCKVEWGYNDPVQLTHISNFTAINIGHAFICIRLLPSCML